MIIQKNVSHAERLEQIKILFQFLLMIFSSVIIGAILTKLCSERYYIIAQNPVSTHFEKLFLEKKGILEVLRSIAIYSSWDMLCVLVVFFTSFSAFNYVATDILLVASGIKTGFSITFLSKYLSAPILSYNLSVLKFSVFVFFKIILLFLLFSYSYNAAIYSLSMRYTSPNGRLKIVFPKLFTFLGVTLAYIGSIMITNSAYCWILYLLK